MPGWMLVTAAALGVAVVAGVVAMAIAARHWKVATVDLSERLMGSARGSPEHLRDGLDALPIPVQRYFRTVLKPGQRLPVAARLTQAGTFRTDLMAAPSAGWRRFEANQVMTSQPPGFVWDASIEMAPLVQVWVRDSYVHGHATMLGALRGAIRIVNARDDASLREGALQRYLAEAVWLPPSLLPSERLQWTAMDESHARATLHDGETVATLEFEFAASGELVGCYTPSRQRAVPGNAGSYEPAPWGARYGDYGEAAGMKVPFSSEVYWVIDGRERPYYRGTNVRITFDSKEGQP